MMHGQKNIELVISYKRVLELYTKQELKRWIS